MSARRTSGHAAEETLPGGHAEPAGALERPHLRDAVCDGLADCGIVALSAAPGMGKSALAAAVSTRRARDGRDVRMLVRGEAGPEAMLERLARFSRSASLAARKGAAITVIVDDVPPFDEREAIRFQRAIGKLRACDCEVLIVMRPEAEQALDCLEANMAVLRASRLRMGAEELASQARPEAGLALAESLTAGVPSLAAALAEAQAGQVRGESVACPSAYDAELARLIALSMRPGIMREERQVRLRMLLMGRGELAGLWEGREEQVGEVLLDIASTDPLFGVDIAAGRFLVAGDVHAGRSRACREALAQVSGDEQDVVADVLDALVLRQDFARAGLVASLLADEGQRSRMVLAHSMDLIDAGHLPLVRAATGISDDEDGMPGELGSEDIPVISRDDIAARLLRPAPSTLPEGIARCAIAALEAEEEAYALIREALPGPHGALERRQLILLDDFHRALSANREAIYMSVPAHVRQGMSARLRRHVLVRALMVQGRFREALEELLDAGVGEGPLTLSGALLLDDLEWARLLSGDDPCAPEADRAAEAGAFLARSGATDIAAYHEELLAAAHALRSRAASFEGQEGCMRRAERRGDAILLIASNLASAVMDMRRSAYLRAHLRAERAIALARDAGTPFLVLIAQMLSALSSAALGERSAPIDCGSVSARGWAECARIVCACAARDDAELIASVQGLSPDGPPGGAEIILDIAMHHLGEVSATLAVVLPEPWRRAIRLPLPVPEERSAADDPEEQPEELDLLEVSLLGEFSVRRAGRLIPLSSWERVSARALLALLCSMRGHKMTRAEILEMLWPEADYIRGRGNVYSALSSLRNTIGQDRDDPRFVVGREEIMLDMAHVRCDVDRLEALGLRVLAREGGAGEVVRNCEEMQAIYRGDLEVVHAEDAHLLLARRSELRELYVDAMVCGAEAALELDDPRKAVWFARSARKADGLREDAIMLLMRACSRQGRSLEARREYESYARRLIEAASIPPSRAMRALAHDIGVAGRSQTMPRPREREAATG